MKIDILTLFPGMFDGFLNESIIKRAIDGKYVCINAADFLNLFTVGKVYTVSNGSITTDTTGDAGYVISKKELQNSFVRLME